MLVIRTVQDCSLSQDNSSRRIMENSHRILICIVLPESALDGEAMNLLMGQEECSRPLSS